MRVDEMAVVEGRFSPAPVRGRLQGDPSGVGPAQETAGAPHGPAGGPCAVNWIRVRSASLEFSLARVPDWQHQGQQHRRASPPVAGRVFQVVFFLPRGGTSGIIFEFQAERL